MASGVDNNAVDEGQKKPSAVVFRVISILIIGAFTANADGSLVLATHPTIGSEFDALSASSWLVISFSLAGAATQTLVMQSQQMVLSRNTRGANMVEH